MKFITMVDTMREKTRRVYVDTTVVYGAPAKKFSDASRQFWSAVRNGEIVIIVSDVLADEIERAPQSVQKLYQAIPESQVERVESTDESDALAEQYVAAGVVGKTHLDDCRHIALATLTQADALVSWNFGDIVYRRAGYNDVNETLGYPRIKIQSPKQLLEAHHDKT